MGLRYDKRQPEDEPCRFCGKPLKHLGLPIMDMVVWSPSAERCDCPEAVKYWREVEERQAAEERERKAREEYERQQARINKLLGQSGIRKRFQQRTFETFKTDTPARRKAYSVAKGYADRFEEHLEDGTGLYIEGTNGTGKTHLAAAIAMELMTKHNIACICRTSGDLLMDIKSAFGNGGKTEAEVLKIYKEVPLLIVDDLGKEQCTDWSISTLYSILNERYESMRPVVITTNYNSDDLVKALTPRGYDSTKAVAIISRLQEVSQVLTMAWEDARKTKR